MSAATLVFCVSLAVIAYVYIGYPVLAWLLARLFGREPSQRDITPSVSLLLPAYNEEAYIEEKLRNCLALDYPSDRLEIVVASDGSTDRTNAIVQRFASRGVKLLAMEHLGKSAMLSRAVPLLRGEVVAFSDISSQLAPDALRKTVRNFSDPSVGCVSGAYYLKGGADLRAHGEGAYWKYEAFLKRQESRLHSILGAHGPFYAIRRSLFTPLREREINDDYLIPMRVIAQGYRAVYEPDVIAWEPELVSVEGEFARRLRIAAGNCQQMIELRHVLTPRYGWVAFAFFSHKVLRTAAPMFLISLLAASVWLPGPWNILLLGLQAAFYASAFAGYLCQRQGRSVRWLSAPFYFCLGNLAMLAGLVKYSTNPKGLVWERARP